jgi:hypothetical protein
MTADLLKIIGAHGGQILTAECLGANPPRQFTVKVYFRDGEPKTVQQIVSFR